MHDYCHMHSRNSRFARTADTRELEICRSIDSSINCMHCRRFRLQARWLIAPQTKCHMCRRPYIQRAWRGCTAAKCNHRRLSQPMLMYVAYVAVKRIQNHGCEFSAPYIGYSATYQVLNSCGCLLLYFAGPRLGIHTTPGNTGVILDIRAHEPCW